jgi:hypothetical protein
MRDWRIVAGVAAATGVVIGLGLGAIFGGTTREDSRVSPGEFAPRNSKAPASEDPQRAGGSDSSGSSEWAALREDFARESQTRIWLTEEIEMLWEELERLNRRLEPPSPITGIPATHNKAPYRFDTRLQFDDARLAASGIALDEIERLRERYETTELDELYLRDQAAREGWSRSSRFRQETQDLEGRLREDLGEEDYDRMLFATGQNNRVRVNNVIGRSPAADAGLLTGDIIIRYANNRIFNPRALRNQTSQGVLGKPVPIEILRNGEITTFFLPRGPLGVGIRGESLAPL